MLAALNHPNIGAIYGFEEVEGIRFLVLEESMKGCTACTMCLEDVSPAAQTPSVGVLALDQALDALSAIDARQGAVVELRFFAGLDVDEAAEALGISPVTVEREWALAKASLYRRLSPSE